MKTDRRLLAAALAESTAPAAEVPPGRAESPTNGPDILNGTSGADVIDGLGGDDVIRGFGGVDTLSGGAGDDLIEGGGGGDTLDGGTGIDTLSYASSSSKVTVRLWNNTATGGHATNDTFSDFENILGSAFNDTLIGDANANVIGGGAGNDYLDGLAGDDILNGGDGADRMFGGDGNDTLEGGAGADELNGGAGIDTLSYAGSDARVVVRLSLGTAESGHAEGDVFTGFENLLGSAFNDTLIGDAGANGLTGGAGDDYLDGLAGNDVLDGGDGDDRIVGGEGADLMAGGAGVDTLIYTGSNARVVVRLWNNTASGGHAAGDVISGFENITGSAFNDSLIGDAGANALTGAAGNDYLDGLAGADVLDGGAGADRLLGGDGDDVLEGGAGADELSGGAGVDTLSYAGSTGRVVVRLWNNTTSAGHAAGDVISGFENILGSAFNDSLIGDAGANLLTGGEGNDYLDGMEGDDLLHGGAGADRLFGRAGADLMEGGAGADELDGGGGIDTLSYATSDARVVVRLWNNTASGGHADGDVISNFENILGSAFNDSLIGSDAANVLTGGAGDDYLDGMNGVDVLGGGDGDDRIVGGAGGDTLDGGAGVDTLIYSGSNARVVVRLWNDTASGGHANGDAISGFENVVGSDHNDSLIGHAGINILTGGAGDDYLDGMDGDDVLDGGAGADRLIGGAGVDTAVYETSGAGVTVTLGALGAGGDAAGDEYVSIENVTGSAHADVLTGDLQANTLAGGAGDDVLTGDDGADVLLGGAGSDQLNGGADEDVLDGGAGRDFLSGGGGADLLLGDTTGLQLISRASDGAQGGGDSTHGSISADGRFVSFRSTAADLSDSDPNGAVEDIFLRNVETGVTTRIGGQGYWSAVADDGSVAWQGTGANIYLWDADTQSNSLILTGVGSYPLITPDGRYVLATTGVGPSLTRYDTTNGSTVSTGLHYPGAISADGAYVVGYMGANGDLYRSQIGVGLSGLIATEARQSDISADGRYVAFVSDSDSVVAGDDNQSSDVFWKDMVTNEVRRISVASDGMQGNGASYDASISADGRFITFASTASNLVAGDTNRASDVFIHDTQTGLTTRLSAGDGAEASRGSSRPTISGDGLRVVFETTASNLVDGDTNAYGDLVMATGDLLQGGSGDDTYEVRSALDRVVEAAGQGIDTVRTALSQYALTDHVENLTYVGSGDFLGRGNASDNVIIGGAGADTLGGLGGSDTLTGGAGADTFTFHIVSDAQTVDAFRDTITDFTSGTDAIRVDYGTVSADFVLANGAADATLGQISHDAGLGRLTVQGASAGGASDIVVLTGGPINVATDVDVDIRVTGGFNVTTLGGDDRVFGGALANVIATGQGNDVIWGGAGDDTIHAGGGADILFGGAGADTLTGGGGFDKFLYYLPNAVSGFNDQQGAGQVRDTITDFNSGVDRLVIDFGGQGAPRFIMRDSIAEGNFEFGGMRYAGGQLIVQGYGGTAEADLVINSANTIDITRDIDVIISIARPDYEAIIETLGGDDVITCLGTPIAPAPGVDFLADGRIGDTVSSGAGDDIVDGGSGDDWINGGAGADRLRGGTGSDTFIYSLAVDAQGAGQVRDTIEDFLSGADHIRIDYGLQQAGFALVDSTQDGLVGAVSYDAATGLFTIQGAGLGTEQDIVIRSQSPVALGDAEGEFSPIMLLDVSVKVDFEGVANFTAFAGDDFITAMDATAFANTFDGGLGNDQIDGGLGDDVILGGGGMDRLTGGADNDYLDGADGDDVLLGGDGHDVLIGGAGDDRLEGGAGDDLLVAGPGDDHLIGGDGADILVTDRIGGGVKLEAGLGDDVIRYTGEGYFRLNNQDFQDGAGTPIPGGDDDPPPPPDSGSLTIMASDAEGDTSGTANVALSTRDLTGFSGVSRGATLIGNAGDNALTGSGHADVLIGGAGNDRLRGMGGIDTLIGGAGEDLYFVAPGVLPGANDSGAWNGTTFDGFAFGSGDQMVFETPAGTSMSFAGTLDLDGEGITFANFRQTLGDVFGGGPMPFSFEPTMLEGYCAVLLTVTGGEAAGQYLVYDRTDAAGFNFAFDNVVRLTNATGDASAADFAHMRSGSTTVAFAAQAGSTDILNYTLRADAGSTLSAADDASAAVFGGEDAFQFLSSQFGGVTEANASNFFVVTGGADLTAAEGVGQTTLSELISSLTEAQAGGVVSGPYFALVYDSDAANGGVNAGTYLVFDYNGTASSGPVLDQWEDLVQDQVIIARWGGMTPDQVGLSASDIWFDVNVAVGTITTVTPDEGAIAGEPGLPAIGGKDSLFTFQDFVREAPDLKSDDAPTWGDARVAQEPAQALEPAPAPEAAGGSAMAFQLGEWDMGGAAYAHRDWMLA